MATIALGGCSVGPPEPTFEPPPDADAFAVFGQEEGEAFALMPDDEVLVAVESAFRDGKRVHVDRIESSDPSVVEVDRTYRFLTHDPGEAQLRYFSEDGQLLGAETVEVAVPDEFVIVPLAAAITAPSRLDAARQWSQDAWHVFRSTTIEAIPLSQGRRLIGYDAISGSGEGGARLELTSAGSFWPTRFFFRLGSPGTGETGEVALQYDGEVVAQAQVVGTGPDDVAELELVDYEGWIWAQARDEDGNVVLGPQVDWNPLPEDQQPGDMLRYDYDPDAGRRTVVTASYGAVSDSISVRMGDRGVSSTRNSEAPYGCSVAAPGTGAGGGFALLLVGGFVALRLRRRS